MAGFIAAQRSEYGIPHVQACRALGVSTSWLYKWIGGDRSPRRARRQALAGLVAWLFRRSWGTAGSPRITADLKDMGWAVSENTVAALMREQGLVARRKKKRRSTTRRGKNPHKAPDLLGRDWRPPRRINQAWVGDLTEIPTQEGKLYLAAILDLRSRRCIGFAMGEHHDAELARAALCVAIAVRGGDIAGVVFHTDQGGEYTGQLFATACQTAGVTQSMGRTGSALDNAVAEAFNSTLEFELLSRQRFTTRAQARRAVAAWIDDYNRVRRHSACGLMSPIAFELAHADDEPTEAA